MKKNITILALGMSIFVVSQEVKKERIKEIVSVLSADEMKGRKIGTPENEVAARYIAEQFKKNNLEYCVGNSYLVPFDYQGKTTYNVCGKKSGKSKKSLAFTAHFDHIGFNDREGDNIYNGADDNASGIAMVVSLSEYFKNQKSNFTHIYMAFNGEEYGMLGSHAMANDVVLKDINENIQAVLNFEMMAMVSQYGKNTVYMTGDDFSNLDELLNKYAQKGLRINPDPYKEHSLFYRSDNVSYARKNILAHSFSTVDMTKATHYHQVNDDISVVDFDNLHLLVNSFGKTIKKLKPKNFQPKYNRDVNLKK